MGRIRVDLVVGEIARAVELRRLLEVARGLKSSSLLHVGRLVVGGGRMVEGIPLKLREDSVGNHPVGPRGMLRL